MRFQEHDVAGLTDERTIARLAGIRYSRDARGREKIESKEHARKRGVKSPDRAEAVMLAFAQPSAGWQLLDLDEAPERPMTQTGGGGTRERLRQQAGSMNRQLREAFPALESNDDAGRCAECIYRGERLGQLWCTLRQFQIDARDKGCEMFDLRAEAFD